MSLSSLMARSMSTCRLVSPATRPCLILERNASSAARLTRCWTDSLQNDRYFRTLLTSSFTEIYSHASCTFRCDDCSLGLPCCGLLRISRRECRLLKSWMTVAIFLADDTADVEKVPLEALEMEAPVEYRLLPGWEGGQCVRSLQIAYSSRFCTPTTRLFRKLLPYGLLNALTADSCSMVRATMIGR